MTTAFAFPSFPGAEKFAPEAIQANLRPVMEQVQAWADLGKKHFDETRAATEAALKSFTGVKDPQAAIDVLKANAQQGLVLAGEQLRASADLGVSQFHATVDAAAAKLPQADAFAPIAKGLKAGVDVAHNSLSSVLEQVAPTAAKKASRRA
ncbi:MAG TPA: hypothetical protein VIP05_27140 [Burkholderiaceae bacterium]